MSIDNPKNSIENITEEKFRKIIADHFELYVATMVWAREHEEELDLDYLKHLLKKAAEALAYYAQINPDPKVLEDIYNKTISEARNEKDPEEVAGMFIGSHIQNNLPEIFLDISIKMADSQCPERKREQEKIYGPSKAIIERLFDAIEETCAVYYKDLSEEEKKHFDYRLKVLDEISPKAMADLIDSRIEESELHLFYRGMYRRMFDPGFILGFALRTMVQVAKKCNEMKKYQNELKVRREETEEQVLDTMEDERQA